MPERRAPAPVPGGTTSKEDDVGLDGVVLKRGWGAGMETLPEGDWAARIQAGLGHGDFNVSPGVRFRRPPTGPFFALF